LETNSFLLLAYVETDTRIASLVDFCEIASRHALANAKMMSLVGMRRYGTCKVTFFEELYELNEYNFPSIQSPLIF